MNTPLRLRLVQGGALCLVAFGLVFAAMRAKHVSGVPQGASPEVEVVQVEQKDVPIFGEWIGTLDGLVNADVRAQVTGYLLRQGYQEGAFVKKGQLLFEIDPRPFQAALDQAEGQLAAKSRCSGCLCLVAVSSVAERRGDQKLDVSHHLLSREWLRLDQ